MPLALRIALILLLAPATAVGGDLTVSVEVAENLADAADPIPILHIHNHSKYAVELQVFHGVPFTHLEEATRGGFSRSAAGGCGNGYHARRLPAGRYEAFPLWSRLGHGPGKSADYRFALPYVEIRKGRKPVAKEALSDPVSIHYGDIAPSGWTVKTAQSSPTVLVGTELETVGKPHSHAPTALARHFLPAIHTCVKRARNRAPWIRGRFSLVAYRYPGGKTPVTYVGTSVLGEEQLEKCIAAIAAPLRLVGKYELTFAIPHPLY